ncbi:hypothetical protein T484DRAFT_1752262 [Baffinella frigidus]|nr:hypothetical protein T484DRAFT_1752262 [Cryptophyta sp. CCMP2293]
MPRKITLTVAEAEAEMASLSEIIDACKDSVPRNRFTARRSRLMRHVLLHANATKTLKQSLVIVHLRSQIHILRAMLLQVGVNVPSIEQATGVSATGVDGLGMQQEWLDEVGGGSGATTYESVIRSLPPVPTDSAETSGGAVDEDSVSDTEHFDDFIEDAGTESNSIESVMLADREYQQDLFSGAL